MNDRPSSTSEQRATWEQVRRGMLQTIRPLQAAHPEDPFTVEIRVVKRSAEGSTSTR